MNARLLLSVVEELAYLMSFMPRKRKAYYFAGMLVSSAVYSLFLVSFSLMIQRMVEFAQTKDPVFMYQSFYILGGSLLLVMIITPGFGYMYQRCVEITVAEIRERLFTKLFKLRMGDFEQQHNGDLASRLNNDVSSLELTYMGVLFNLLMQLTFGIGAVVAMFTMHWQIALVSLAVLLLCFAASAWFVQRIRGFSDRSVHMVGKMTGKFADYAGGIQLVKLFHVRPVYEQYREMNEQVARLSIQTAANTGLMVGLNYFFGFATFCGMIVVGSFMHASGLIAISTVVALAVLQISVTHSVMSLGEGLSEAQTSLAGAARIKEVLYAEEEPERMGSPAGRGVHPAAADSEHPGTAEASERAAVEFRGVDFSYQPGRKVLDNMSVTVLPGQSAAFVGASGSGKSTLVKLLLGFYPVDRGEIWLNGQPLGHYTLEELRGMIAYVPQDAYLFSGTIEENIRHGRPEASDEEVRQAAEAAYADHFIEELPERYQTQVGERGAALSGGQRQRIAIARAILKNAPILLLDEATSALDNESEYWVQQALNRLMQGRTTLMIAHRLSTVEHADAIMVMNQGSIVEQGTHQQLLGRQGYYARLHG